MKYEIGDLVADEDGKSGIVVIRWDDGDLRESEDDAAHPNPIIVGHWVFGTLRDCLDECQQLKKEGE